MLQVRDISNVGVEQISCQAIDDIKSGSQTSEEYGERISDKVYKLNMQYFTSMKLYFLHRQHQEEQEVPHYDLQQMLGIFIGILVGMVSFS